MRHSTKKPTKAESARFEAIKALGCICCRKLGLPMQGGRTECHHLLSAGRRRGHMDSIPLCVWHHKSETWQTMNARQMAQHFGPSLAKGSKPFHAAFGSDDELLAETNKLIGVAA